jgi:two-component system, NtrC family, sensor histidine kinase PilS
VINDSLIFSKSQGRRILRLYHLYRLVIGSVLVLMISSNLDQALLKLPEASLLSYVSWLYLIINLLFSLLLRKPQRLAPVFALALVDVVLLSTLLYAAGGIASGIGNLLMVAVAIANILLRGSYRSADSRRRHHRPDLPDFLSQPDRSRSQQPVPAGRRLGSPVFCRGAVRAELTERLQQTETLAEQRATDVANLEALNALILQRMRTGILLLDSSQRLLLSNPSASQLLGRECVAGTACQPGCPELNQRLRQWQQQPGLRPQKLQAHPEGPVLQPSFVPCHGDEQHLLVFLDDISQIAQQAQQLKLASLGR